MTLCMGVAGLAPPAHAEGGELVWARAIGGMDWDKGHAVAVDGAGNVYTTGYFHGMADFDPGESVFELTAAGNADIFADIFVQKLDADGNFLWARRMGGAGDDRGFAIAVDSEGNIHATGRFSGTADFDPGPGVLGLTSAGNWDIFVSKLDTDGNLEWARRIGGTDWDEGHAIAVDSAGNVYTTGWFRGIVDFDPGLGVFELNGWGAFVSKLNTDGNFVWADSHRP